jgi:hypothetical protein
MTALRNQALAPSAEETKFKGDARRNRLQKRVAAP